jgi:hypothetical protein
MVYNFISMCISVLSVPSVVKHYFDRLLPCFFNHREHRDTQSLIYLMKLFD